MKKNLFIYITAFFCGMSIMAVELSATRLLAPYFGTSMIVWTVIIGLIMIFLSIGNIVGGRIADKSQSKDKLYFFIWLASIWIALIPLAGKYIIALSALLMIWLFPNSLVLAGTVFSCLIIFSFPLVVLGMTAPFLVKLGVADMAENGKTTGEIYALSTFGSIIGTFIPTFLTIPSRAIGTGKTFFIFALLLNLICLYYFISSRTRIIRTAASTGILLVLLIIPFNNPYTFWKPVVLEDESLYNYLQVTEEGDAVVLSTNVAFGVQSVYRKNRLLSGYYYEYLLMGPFFARDGNFQKKQDVLVLGLGAGTFAKQCGYYFQNSRVDGVEIDQKIVDLGKKYFDLKINDAKVYIDDGRTFLMGKNARQYDLILIDAYHDITIPFHMSTKEFFTQVKKHLRPNGILEVNINIHSQKNSELLDYFTQTVKSVSQKVYRCDINSLSNTIIIASDDPDALDNYYRNTQQIDRRHPLYTLSRYVGSNLTEITESKYVFTDDVAPVELMGQKVLDEMVMEGLAYFRDRIKSSKNGIRELINIINGG